MLEDQCSLFNTLFWVALGCAIVGNVLGMIAWQQRRPELSAWHPLRDQLYLFRPKYFVNPEVPTRRLAIVVLGVGVVAALGAAAIVVPAAYRGAPSFCGMSF